MFKTILLLIFCLAYLIACKKTPPETLAPPEFKLDPEGLKYIQLRLGQYFIYKDSTSGVTDSVIVRESKLEKEAISSSPAMPGTREKFWLTLVAKRPVFDSTWVQGYAEANETGQIGFGFGFSVAYFLYPVCTSCNYSSLLPSLTVEGKNYTNVVVTHNQYGVDFSITYYWAASTGLIKVVHQQLTPLPQKRTTFILLRHN